jgi:hypothetical protein
MVSKWDSVPVKCRLDSLRYNWGSESLKTRLTVSDSRTKYERVLDEGGQPAEDEPLLSGITKALFSTGLFISAALFQGTARVLTES